MTARLPINRDALAGLCRRHRIRRLALFGSVLKARGCLQSGIDVLIDLESHAGDDVSTSPAFDFKWVRRWEKWAAKGGVASMAKQQKTPAELNALLHQRVERHQVGQIPNPQWVKIVPADPNKEGANWKVAHSGVPGPFADFIEEEMQELQKLYDMKS